MPLDAAKGMSVIECGGLWSSIGYRGRRSLKRITQSIRFFKDLEEDFREFDNLAANIHIGLKL
jgi:hypothetical protein